MLKSKVAMERMRGPTELAALAARVAGVKRMPLQYLLDKQKSYLQVDALAAYIWPHSGEESSMHNQSRVIQDRAFCSLEQARGSIQTICAATPRSCWAPPCYCTAANVAPALRQPWASPSLSLVRAYTLTVDASTSVADDPHTCPGGAANHFWD